MKPNLFILCILFPTIGFAQMYRYNCADTLVEKINTRNFLSGKLVYFDSTYVRKDEYGNTQFKIGKVCDEIGCVGTFDQTGKIQSGWWLLENKIVLCYLTPISNGRFKSELKVWRYDAARKVFVLIL